MLNEEKKLVFFNFIISNFYLTGKRISIYELRCAFNYREF